MIGVDTAKDAIYSKLKVITPGPGYCHFPIVYQQEFFNQLTSEEVRTRFVRGHPVRYWFAVLYQSDYVRGKSQPEVARV
jgi:phage terminase large subunit GpA-like protein